jgi:type VI protein secretion system component VasK
MTTLLLSARYTLLAGMMAATWVAGEHAAFGQGLLAQTGAAKTAIGYLLFFLAVVLGLLVACRPSGRQWQYTEEELREQQAKKQGNLKR